MRSFASIYINYNPGFNTELFKIREMAEILLESTEIGENYNRKGTVRRKK